MTRRELSTLAADALTSAGTTSSVGWFLLGAAVAATAAILVFAAMRLRTRRSVTHIASALDALAEPNAESRFGILSDIDTGAALEPVVDATRRAVNAIATRETRLEGRLRHLEAILDSTANGFIALDPQLRVLDLNRAGASMLDVTVDQARGRLLVEVARHPALNRFVSAAIQRTDPLEAEFELEGQPSRSVRATAEPLRDATKRPVGALVSLQDVTRMRRFESLRSDFVANVSHELRTPITAIKGYVETLLQIGSDDPDRVRKFLEIVQRNTSRLSSLVEDLLALASLEDDASRRNSTIEMTPNSAAAIIDQVCEQLGGRADARRISIERSVSPNLIVIVNRVLVEQALANLVSNAVGYSREGTRVMIRAFAIDEATVAFSVSDQGPGIARKHLDRIFERFYRVDRSRARPSSGANGGANSGDGGGTGLGLAIVKHIAHVHGGRVDVESEVGVGSTFRLLFPASRPDPHPESQEPQQEIEK